MKQLLQDLKKGNVILQEVAVPLVRPGYILIQTTRSLISTGTERMLLDFGKASYLQKARQQPEKVAQVIDKIRTDGLMPTIESVQAKLEQPLPIGYCNVGVALQVGQGVDEVKPGDRVASNGHHAEIVLVPKNLCAKIPDEITDEEAAFTVVGATALQGVRLLNLSLGETVAVFGLGLIGLLAVQILRAHGARVIGFDLDSTRVQVAQNYGVIAKHLTSGVDPIAAGLVFSNGKGIDAVLITASTDSHQLMHQAAQMSRKRGRIVLTGVTGLNLRRSDFYEKELTFQVSCAYGPGRYDPSYEDKGNDYPYPFVRWTAKRNFETVLELMRNGSLSVNELISLRVPLEKAQDAYSAVSERSAIGIIIEYKKAPEGAFPKTSLPSVVTHREQPAKSGPVVLGVIGAGNFTQLRLLPILQKTQTKLKWIATQHGLSGSVAAIRFGFQRSTTDYQAILRDTEVNAVLIATRHDSHSHLVQEALRARKHVFVEKPLCLTLTQLEEIITTYQRSEDPSGRLPILMVGFNRRFSPLIQHLVLALKGRQAPVAMNFTCNAGAIPADHWIHDPGIGGGRIIGEVCHFIDLLHYVSGEPIARISSFKQGRFRDRDLEETAVIGLQFAGGSIGNISYFANGSKKYPKEQFQVFSEGRVFALDNFIRLDVSGARSSKGKRLLFQNKGHANCLHAFLEAIAKGLQSPISFESLLNSTKATFAVVEAMRTNAVIEVDPTDSQTKRT